MSQAYSTSSWLAMMMKFWSIHITLIMPSTMAKVMTDVARKMQVRFVMKDSASVCSSFFFINFEKNWLAFGLRRMRVISNLMKMKLRKTEKTPHPTINRRRPSSTRASQSDCTLRSTRYFSTTVSLVSNRLRCRFLRMEK